MSTPALLLLSDFAVASKTELGFLGVQYGKLHKYAVPLLPMVALSRESLIQVAQTNNLLQKVEKVRKQKMDSAKLRAAISTTVRSQRLPESLATAIAKTYAAHFKNAFVSLLTSPLLPGAPELTVENIRGESALQEAVLDIWADSIAASNVSTARTTLTLESLIPTAILIQRSPDATVSGTGFTRHPLTGDRDTLLVQATWGSRVSPLPTGEGDSFELDAQSYHLLRKNIRTQTKTTKPVLGGFETKPLPKDLQGTATLSQKQLERIAHLLAHVRQKSLHHYRVIWALEKELVYCVRLQELNPVTTHPVTTGRTITKLYANIHNASGLTPEVVSVLDGVGILRLEYSYAHFGMHPLAALESTYHRLLKKELSAVITKVSAALGSQPLIVRSQNFSSTELRELTHAQRFEPTEVNPDLGMRGGLKALLQPKWLEFELSLLAELQEKLHTPLGLLVPFVRTPTELARITKAISQHQASGTAPLELWLELSTPATVFSLSEFPLTNVAGVVLNFTQLHGLLNGFDPKNTEVAPYYPPTLSNLELLVKHAVAGLKQATASQNLRTTPLLRIQLDSYSSQYVEIATQYGAEGIIVHPRVVPMAKSSIMEAESRTTLPRTEA